MKGLCAVLPACAARTWTRALIDFNETLKKLANEYKDLKITRASMSFNVQLFMQTPEIRNLVKDERAVHIARHHHRRECRDEAEVPEVRGIKSIARCIGGYMLGSIVEPQHKGETKFIFFSGKGGVGKSTMSCATAVWLARKGYSTLLVTTDPAPNLSDIFRQPIGSNITPIKDVENLSAVEIDPDAASDAYRERVIAPMRELLDEKSLETIKEQMKSPCVEEVAAFDKFIDFMCEPHYDVVIFDTAPTGHTIRLLELPSGWSEEISKGGATCIGPSSSLTGAKERYDEALSYLRDSKKTSFIFVLKPERLSLIETKRSTEELSKLGVKTSLLIVNGVLPDEAVTDKFFQRIKKEEEKEIARINDEFKGIEIVLYPLKDGEVNGLRSLEAVGDYLFEGKRETSYGKHRTSVVEFHPWR